jgi:hypothetical protein
MQNIMKCPVLSFVACTALQYFSIMSHYRQDFKEITEYKSYVLIFSTNFVSVFLIRRRLQRDIIMNVHRHLVNFSLFLSEFNKTCNFSLYYPKILKYQTSYTSVQWQPSCSLKTSRQSYRHEDANNRFPQFCKRAYVLWPWPGTKPNVEEFLAFAEKFQRILSSL